MSNTLEDHVLAVAPVECVIPSAVQIFVKERMFISVAVEYTPYDMRSCGENRPVCIQYCLESHSSYFISSGIPTWLPHFRKTKLPLLLKTRERAKIPQNMDRKVLVAAGIISVIIIMFILVLINLLTPSSYNNVGKTAAPPPVMVSTTRRPATTTMEATRTPSSGNFCPHFDIVRTRAQLCVALLH